MDKRKFCLNILKILIQRIKSHLSAQRRYFISLTEKHIKSKLVLSEEEEVENSVQENTLNCFQTEADLQDPNFYHTTLSSERLGLDIFGIVKERRQRLQNSKRNKVQESELYKYGYKRTIESTRISQKQSFALFAKKESSHANHASISKQSDTKIKKKAFQAFQIGNAIAKESKPDVIYKSCNLLEKSS